jgi:hypothetical protein
MITVEEIVNILKKELPIIKDKYGVKTIGIFGSYVREEQDENSDLDLLIQFEKPIGFFKFIALEDYLTERVGIKVELVTEDALKPLIKPHVMKEVVYV